MSEAVAERLVEEEGPPTRVDSLAGTPLPALRALLAAPEFAAAAYSAVASHAGVLPDLREVARGGVRGVSERLRRLGGRLVFVQVGFRKAAWCSAHCRLRMLYLDADINCCKAARQATSQLHTPTSLQELRTRLLRAADGADMTAPGRERVFEFEAAPGGELLIAAPPPGACCQSHCGLQSTACSQWILRNIR